MYIYRFLFLIALSTACHCGCTSIFNPDSAIDAAITAYSSDKNSFSMDDETSDGGRDDQRNLKGGRLTEPSLNVSTENPELQQDRALTDSIDLGLSQSDEPTGDHKAGSSLKTQDDQTSVSESSWDKIEQSVLNSLDPNPKSTFQSLPNEFSRGGTSRSGVSRNAPVQSPGLSRKSDNRGLGSETRNSSPLIQIYDRESVAGNPELSDQRSPTSNLPLIQRSIVSDVKIPGIAFDQIFETDTSISQSAKRSADAKGVNWRDSLEAAGEHLREELKSGQIGEDDAKNLTVFLEILDSVDGDNRSLVSLVSKIKDLKESLPPHHYNALRTVIAQTKIDGSSGQQLDDLFRQALDVVSETSDLGIKKAAICNEVTGFGKFKQFESNRFSPGDEVLIYCEIENFSTEDIDGEDGEVHQCEFNAQIQFVNGQGETDHVQSLAKITDQSKSNRRDFYILFRIRIPDLSNGDHSLQVQIQDKVGRKTARLDQPIRFQIAK